MARKVKKEGQVDQTQGSKNYATPDELLHDVQLHLKCKTGGQKTLAKYIKEKEITICSGPPGTGKAQPLDAIILTPNGKTLMGEIKIGDYVMGNDGEPTKVIGVYPQGEKDIYRITFSDETYTECCKEHLWLTQTDAERNFKHRITASNGKRQKIGLSGKPGKVRTTEDIMKSLTCGIAQPKLNHSIPLVNTVKFNHKDILINPYLLGVLLGDGCLGFDFVRFSTYDNEILENINSIISEKYMVNKIGKYDYSITTKRGSSNMLLDDLRYYNLAGLKSDQKYIPNDYLFNDPEIRLEILRGLLDTDGTVDKKNGSPIYYSTSEKLINNVKFIVESFGGIATKSSKTGKYNLPNKITRECSTIFSLYIKLPNEITPFKLTRKINLLKPKVKYKPIRLIKNVEFVGKKLAQCIMVDNDSHLYLTNDCIVTHNTYVTCAQALALLKHDTRYDKVVLVKSVVQLKDEEVGFLKGNLKEKMEPVVYSFIHNFEKIIGKQNTDKLHELGGIEERPIAFMRGITIDNAIIIIDEVQNISIKNIRTIMTRLGDNSKMVFLGDENQIDIKDSRQSALKFLLDNFAEETAVGTIRLGDEDIVRNPLIKVIEEIFKKNMK